MSLANGSSIVHAQENIQEDKIQNQYPSIKNAKEYFYFNEDDIKSTIYLLIFIYSYCGMI